MSRRLLLLSLMLVFAGCGSSSTQSDRPPAGSEDPSPSLDDAAVELRELIDATVAAVLPGNIPEVGESSGRQLCRADSDEEREDYWVFVDVPPSHIGQVIEQVRRYWEGRGFEVGGGDGAFAPHEATVQFDAYGARVGASGDPGEVVIAGSTRCFTPT